LEEVAVCAGHEVLIEVDDNILLIVGNLQGILDKQQRPHPINLLNIMSSILIIILNNVLLSY